jgi:hypothetical protein
MNFWRKTKQGKTNFQSDNFDSEKVDQDEDFYYKDILHFFLE